MSARVVKAGDAAEIAPFVFSAAGLGSHAGKGVSSFVFPEFDGFVPEPAPDEPFEPVSDEEMIETAEAEAARIIALAEEQGEIIKQVAAEKAAHEAGKRFEDEVAKQITEVRARFTSSIDEIAGLAAHITQDIETQVVELAIDIARKIVGHEIEVNREIALSMVRVSLEKLHNRSVAEVHLNPEDLAFIDENRRKLDFRGTLHLVGDDSIARGGCLIHTETGDIDARIDSQFDEIAHGLFN